MQELIYLILTNEANQKEQKAFNDWLNESEKNIAFFENEKAIWNSLSIIEETPSCDVNHAWNKFSLKLQTRKTISYTYKYAAVIVIAIIAASSVFMLNQSSLRPTYALNSIETNYSFDENQDNDEIINTTSINYNNKSLTKYCTHKESSEFLAASNKYEDKVQEIKTSELKVNVEEESPRISSLIGAGFYDSDLLSNFQRIETENLIIYFNEADFEINEFADKIEIPVFTDRIIIENKKTKVQTSILANKKAVFNYKNQTLEIRQFKKSKFSNFFSKLFNKK